MEEKEYWILTEEDENAQTYSNTLLKIWDNLHRRKDCGAANVATQPSTMP